MTDLEITRLCAEAMGYKPRPHANRKFSTYLMWVVNGRNYNPLTDDAQAMALLKKFSLWIAPNIEGVHWNVSDENDHEQSQAWSDDLNRAICECVAKMQAAKEAA